MNAISSFSRHERGRGGRHGADGHHGVLLGEAAGAAVGRRVGRDDPEGGRHHQGGAQEEDGRQGALLIPQVVFNDVGLMAGQQENA